MRAEAVKLVADIIDRIETRLPGPGRPPVATLEVIWTLRFFVREGVQWRELKAVNGRAKRGSGLTGPNSTDRGKRGTKYHVAVSTDGLPLAVVPSAANVHDTRLFPDLLRLAQVVCVAIGRLYADAGYAPTMAGR